MQSQGLWWKLTLSFSIIAAVVTGVYVVINRLHSETLSLIVGALVTLIVILVIGVLLIAKDLIQAYIMRRVVQEDDMADLKQMALTSQLLRGGGGRRRRLPQGSRRDPVLQQYFTGTGDGPVPVDYQDTIHEEEPLAEEISYE